MTASPERRIVEVMVGVRAFALVTALAVGGCNPRPTIAVGGVTVGAGLLIAAVPDSCDDELVCITNKDVGTFIALVGLVMVGVGLLGLAGEGSQPAPQVVGAPPPPFPAGGHAPPAPVEPAIRPPGLIPPEKPLPALELMYTSPADRQFAIQVSAAARRGDCRTAVALAKELSVDDRHRLATVDPDYARCEALD
jgi:hypothetical protein